MPWTVSDVDKHNKGLSAKQKRQWVKVANSVLEECKEVRGKNCDAKAIKSANNAVRREA